MNRIHAIALLVAVLSLPSVQAETLYVTDQLRRGMFPDRAQTERRIKLLGSGDAVEILERDALYARVRDSAGAEGWVKVGFLVAEKPAALRVEEIEAELAALRVELNRARASDAAQQVADLQSEREGLIAERDAARAELDAQARELAELRSLEREVSGARAQSGLWVLLALVAGLVVGGLAGYTVYARRLRQRFSGLSLG
jgi:SH3 domain protein